MVKNYVLLSIWLLIVLGASTNAQNYSHDFGFITQDEINMKCYEKDKEAEAVILYDIGNSRFVRDEYSFNVVFERKTKIKIFTKAGFKYGEIEIPFYQKDNIYEEVTEIKGFTYNYKNGVLNKTALDPNDSFDEKTSKSWNLKKFAMPDIQEGSIIEFSYEIVSPYKFNLQDWEFQGKIPTVYSEYVAKIIPFWEYSYILQGRNKFDTFEKYVDNGLSRHFAGTEFKDMVYRFVMKDMPAFSDESYITSVNDYITKIDFQLAKVHRLDGSTSEIITTWPKLSNTLLKEPNFGKYVKTSEKLAQQVIDVTLLTGKSEMEKVKYLVDYVKDNYSWNKRKGDFATKSAKKFIKEKTGNCADLNLFMTGILRAFNIEAYPVIISTRDHGKIKHSYPFHHFFNYVVVLVKCNDKFIITDATEPFCAYNRIPPRCINDKGLIIKKDSEEWVGLNMKYPSVSQKEFDINLTQDNDSMACTAKYKFNEYDALYYRNKWMDNSNKIEESIIEKGMRLVGEIETKNHKLRDQPYEINFNASIPVESFNNKLYLSPFLNEVILENPFKKKTREYPIDMIYAKTRIFGSSISLPNGYEVSEFPENYRYSNDLVEILFNSVMKDGIILTTGSYMFKKDIYSPDEYSRIKYYYSEIIQKFNEKIVLVKELENTEN